MKYNKKIALFITILIVIFILICIIPIRKDIDKTLDCIDFYKGTDNNAKKSTMTIKGIYYDFLFSKDSFLGEISVDSWDLSNDDTYKLSKLDLSTGYDSLNCKHNGEYMTLGTIVADSKFNQVLICVYEEDDNSGYSWHSSNSRVISAPANSLKEARINADDITTKLNQMDMIEWYK